MLPQLLQLIVFYQSSKMLTVLTEVWRENYAGYWVSVENIQSSRRVLTKHLFFIYTKRTYMPQTRQPKVETTIISLGGYRRRNGTRMIVVSADNANGFIPNSILMLQLSTKAKDYHSIMNFANTRLFLSVLSSSKV